MRRRGQEPPVRRKITDQESKKWKKVEDQWTFRSGWGKNVKIPGCGSDSKGSDSGDQQTDSSWSKVEGTSNVVRDLGDSAMMLGHAQRDAGPCPAESCHDPQPVPSTRSWSEADCSVEAGDEQAWNEVARWQAETSQESDSSWSCCGSTSCRGADVCRKAWGSGCEPVKDVSADDFTPWTTSRDEAYLIKDAVSKGWKKPEWKPMEAIEETDTAG